MMALECEQESSRRSRLAVVPRQQGRLIWHEIVAGHAETEAGDGFELWLEPLEKAIGRGWRASC